MEKLTLPANVWTRCNGRNAFQSRTNQSGVRIHYGQVAPAIDTELYFVTPEYDLKQFVFRDYGSLNIYLMPDEAQSIEIVVF